MKPSDCIAAFGIPMSEAEFWDAKDDAGRDFVTNCCPVWQVYNLDIISHFEEVTPHFERLGVQIIRTLRLTDLRGLFNNNSDKTIILFSHWNDDSMEFFDGMVSLLRIDNSLRHCCMRQPYLSLESQLFHISRIGSARRGYKLGFLRLRFCVGRN